MTQQLEVEIYYPESDGQPMGEPEWHFQLAYDLVFILKGWLAGRADAHVAGNLFIYYVQGDNSQVICPDVFIAFGSHKRRIETYRTWRDGPFPNS
jgi:Uma2 family endonuclease